MPRNMREKLHAHATVTTISVSIFEETPTHKPLERLVGKHHGAGSVSRTCRSGRTGPRRPVRTRPPHRTCRHQGNRGPRAASAPRSRRHVCSAGNTHNMSTTEERGMRDSRRRGCVRAGTDSHEDLLHTESCHVTANLVSRTMSVYIPLIMQYFVFANRDEFRKLASKFC